MRSTTALCSLALLTSAALADPWAPPPSYYASVSGTGATLKSSLRTAMTTGHIQRTYGDFRFASPLFDADPTTPGRILLAYTRASVSGTWDSGSTWNREHVWPQSLQPGSVSNSSIGNLGDPHALRPCNPGVNSSRGNLPFGFASTTGANRSLGGFYFTGDADRGDIARSLFYSDTRWGPTLGIQLVNGSPGSNQMGDLASLVAWHYLDAPDEFERRRNHVVFSQAQNPSYYTNNRNAFIDHPEVVWSVYVDQANDTTLTLAGGGNTGGASTLNVSLGAVLVGETSFLTTPVTLEKSGLDGTYFSVTTSADATASITGRHNAFPITTAPTDARVLTVGFDPAATASPGDKAATVTIDNLDVTTGAGAGRAALDGDDTINLSLLVLDHANASFSPLADLNSTTIDLGPVAPGATLQTTIDLHNLDSPSGFTAALDTEPGSASGDTAAITITSPAFDNIPPGAPATITATIDTAAAGTLSATYTIRTFDDRALSGWTEGDALVLTINATIASAGCSPADVTTTGTSNGTPDGVIDISDYSYYLTLWAGADPAADVTTTGTSNGIPDGAVDISDFSYYLTLWAAGCP